MQVDDVCGDQAHVTLFAPPSMSDEPAFQVIQSQLKELENTVDVIELYPAIMPGYNPNLEDDEIKEMATFIENVRLVDLRHFCITWSIADLDKYIEVRLQ